MKIPGEYIIDVCYIFFIVISIYFYYRGLYTSDLDYMLGFLAIFVGILVVPLRGYVNLIFGHLFYSLYLIFVTILSKNKYLLGFNVIMLINIILSRFLYSGCLLIQLRNDDKVSIPLNNIIVKFTNMWDGNYVYPSLLGISTYRFLNIISCDNFR